MEIYPVSHLIRLIRGCLEEEFGRVLVQGEVSSLARPGSGHWYFNLKDDQAQVSCVCFRGQASRIKFRLEEGMEVIAQGRVSVYEPRGQFQLVVEDLQPVGVGALQLAFEQLKQKLAQRGWFDPSHKKPLPFLPRGIGLVTSPTGAALQDMLNILRRRFPAVPILLNPVLVQGEGAAGQIAQAIRQFQSLQDRVDLLIVGRGGGSLEDLWAFNEEPVAQAIFESEIPIISAVGHETDFTLADLVADLRAPTPSAAAELAVPLQSELLAQVLGLTQDLHQAMQTRLRQERQRLEACQKRLRSPGWAIQAQMQRLDELDLRLRHQQERRLTALKNRLEKLQESLCFHSPSGMMKSKKITLRHLQERLGKSLPQILERKGAQLGLLGARLGGLNPLTVLGRGFARLSQSGGAGLTSVEQARPGQIITARLKDGSLTSRVEEVHPDQQQLQLLD